MPVLDDHEAEIILSPADVLAAAADLDRRTALFALAVRRLEVSGEYATDGTVSIAAWLRNNARMTSQRARDVVTTGRFLDKCEHFAVAAVSGALSASKITVARRTGKTKYAAMMHECEQELVKLLAGLDIRSTERAVDHWTTRADAIIDEKSPPIERPCELTYNTTMDDVTRGTFSLNEAAGTEFDKAIQTAMTYPGKDKEPARMPSVKAMHCSTSRRSSTRTMRAANGPATYRT